MSDSTVSTTAVEHEVATSEPTAEAETMTKAEAVSKARSEAVTALTKKYRDEFNTDVQARVLAYGHEWSPRPTAAEKARSEIVRLANEHGLTITLSEA